MNGLITAASIRYPFIRFVEGNPLLADAVVRACYTSGDQYNPAIEEEYMEKRDSFSMVLSGILLFVFGLVFLEGLRLNGVNLSNVSVTATLGAINMLNIGFWTWVLPAQRNYKIENTKQNKQTFMRSIRNTFVVALLLFALGVILTVLSPVS